MEQVAESLDSVHSKNPTKIYVHDRKTRQGFLIHHSAQDVSYDMREFVERNIDCIPDAYEECMTQQTDTLVQCIYQMVDSLDNLTKSDGKKLKTIWGKFDL